MDNFWLVPSNFTLSTTHFSFKSMPSTATDTDNLELTVLILIPPARSYVEESKLKNQGESYSLSLRK